MIDLPFDKILVQGGSELTVLEFLKLPLSQRIALILERKLSFTSADKPVDRNYALRCLMDAAKHL